MNTPIHFNQAKFLISAVKLGGCPTEIVAEVAFIGRSNSGKSSAINALTNQKGLAKTSKTPGRTQLINFFALANNLALVDLPGYGYAKVTESIKASWEKMVTSYLMDRMQLQGLVILMDIRHPLKDIDLQMINWSVSSQLPTHVLLTKADKLKKGAAKTQLLAVQKSLSQISSDISVQLFSSQSRQGVDELAKVASNWLTIPS